MAHTPTRDAIEATRDNNGIVTSHSNGVTVTFTDRVPYEANKLMEIPGWIIKDGTVAGEALFLYCAY